jgi:hypothetical protein
MDNFNVVLMRYGQLAGKFYRVGHGRYFAQSSCYHNVVGNSAQATVGHRPRRPSVDGSARRCFDNLLDKFAISQ